MLYVYIHFCIICIQLPMIFTQKFNYLWNREEKAIRFYSLLVRVFNKFLCLWANLSSKVWAKVANLDLRTVLNVQSAYDHLIYCENIFCKENAWKIIIFLFYIFSCFVHYSRSKNVKQFKIWRFFFFFFLRIIMEKHGYKI